MKESIAEILPKLNGVKKIRGGYIANCPAHDDKHASLSISINNERPLIYCHAGCTFQAIVDALQLESHAIGEKTIEAIYDYYDEDWNLKYQIVRFYPKSFRHRRPDGQGGWIWDRKGVTPLLYRLPQVIRAISNNEYIFIVEGEKDCDTLKKWDSIATTCSGGVKGWRPEFTDVFRKAKVVLLPDNDDAGYEYAIGIARLLYGWADSLKLIKLDVPTGGDVTDFLAKHDIEKLFTIIKNSPEFVPTGAITREEYHAIKGHLIYLHGLIKKLRPTAKAEDKYIIK